MTILLILIYISIKLINIHGYFNEYNYGNELQQLLKYISIINQIDNNFNETNYFMNVSQCERSTIPELGFRNYICRHTIRNYMQQSRSYHWNQKIIKTKNQPVTIYDTDCQYNFNDKNIYYDIISHRINFTINQSNCYSKFQLALGGSTFEIYSKSEYHLNVCNTIDNFDNTYTVYCYLSNDFIYFNKNSLSMNLTITLHYEHFDAFCDIGRDNHVSLSHILYDNLITILNPFKLNQISNKSFSFSSYPNTLGESFWINTKNESLGLIPILGSDIYEWKGKINKYLYKQSLNKCLQQTMIWYVGESHMRYQFDITMDRYIDRLRLGRYHSNYNISGISYSDNTFAYRMKLFIDSLPCNTSNPTNISVVIQIGAWDLQFFSPRAFIRNPNQGISIINAISNSINNKCNNDITFIYMTAMPHPYCKPHQDHCIRLMNYWRNNGAIRAINQFMINELYKLNHKSIKILDVLPIILPRFPYDDIICVDHFLCNDQPRGFVTTPPGVALANEVILLSCSSYLNEYQDITQLYCDNQLYAVKYDNITKWYIVTDGCSREIPDQFTFDHFHLDLSKFIFISNDTICDIPTCHSPVYPSRKNGLLYQTFSERSIYYMDDGYRRPIKNMQTLVNLNLDLDNVTHILEGDLFIIPKGEIITGISDVISK